LDHNGWLTASELGTYIKQQVDTVAKGSQHVSHVRIDGNGDTVLVQQHKAVPQPDTAVQLPLKGREAAKAQYEQAVALLQGGKYAEEALARLDRAIEYDPTFGDAYVLKSYLRLEVLPQLDEALAAGEQAVKHAPNNPEAFYTLGLVHEKMEHYRQAEQAFTQAAKLNPNNQEVYFALGKLYADELADDPKSVEAFRRYLELGGSHARARAAVSQAEQEGSPGPGLP
jgi:tetratricopeptide (TPR) repeat protein